MFLGGLLIGGAEELQAALSDGSFKDALDGSNEPALPADLREAVDRTLAQQPAVSSTLWHSATAPAVPQRCSWDPCKR